MKIKGKIQNLDIEIAKCIKRHRLEQGITGRELANYLNISDQQYHKYEKAYNRISAVQLFKICSFLKISILDVMPVSYNLINVQFDNQEYRLTKTHVKMISSILETLNIAA